MAKNTVIGQISDLTVNQINKQSRLEIQIRKYVKFLVILACSVASIAFVIAGFLQNWVNMMPLFSNGFLVCVIGMVPCGKFFLFLFNFLTIFLIGLPATVTSILSLLARKLSKKNIYLKRLDICEALGQVNIIASDKTGTLTMNIMTVTKLWFWNEIVDGKKRNLKYCIYKLGLPISKKTDIKNKSIKNYDKPIEDILECMAVCNSANFINLTGLKKNQKPSLLNVEFTQTK